MAFLERKFFALALGMVITGSVNTLSTKLADQTESVGIDNTVHTFEHPFFQALGMFLGEVSCLVYFYASLFYRRHRLAKEIKSPHLNPLILLIPALCDMTATSCMYIGLNWTYASIFQMLRGSLVVFTGLLSLVFLKKNLPPWKWIGIFFIVAGLVCVGVSSVFSSGNDSGASNPVWGIIIILISQLFSAIQMVVEDRFLSRFKLDPMQIVGWEGFWGFSMLSILLIPMYFIPNFLGSSDTDHFENTPDALVQIANSWIILVAILGNIISIAFFNFFGVSVTKSYGATTRVVLDSFRTILIWVFSMIVGWQSFETLQMFGFLVLLIGLFVYNEILVLNFGPKLLPESLRSQKRGTQSPEEEEVSLLNDEALIQ